MLPNLQREGVKMKYTAQSDLWRLDHVIRTKPITTTNKGQSRILGQFRQIFPLTLFPDEVIIEELRIVHVQNDGPWAKQIYSIMATDIACVNASAGPFFGHVHIQSLTGGPTIMVDNLPRAAVFKIRSLVEGIALASREGLIINQSNLEEEKQSLMAAGAVETA